MFNSALLDQESHILHVKRDFAMVVNYSLLERWPVEHLGRSRSKKNTTSDICMESGICAELSQSYLR